MTMMMRFRHRLGSAPLAMAVAMLLASAPVGAATGHHGVHVLVDTIEYPAVACIYSATHELVEMRIRAPIVFGYDRTAGTDSQTVGWRFRVQSGDAVATAGPTGTLVWTNWATSSFLQAPATDKQNAAFTARTYTFGPEVLDHLFWRIRVDLRWYHPAGVVDGTANLSPDLYRTKDPDNGQQLVPKFCGSSI